MTEALSLVQLNLSMANCTIGSSSETAEVKPANAKAKKNRTAKKTPESPMLWKAAGREMNTKPGPCDGSAPL